MLDVRGAPDVSTNAAVGRNGLHPFGHLLFGASVSLS